MVTLEMTWRLTRAGYCPEFGARQARSALSIQQEFSHIGALT